MCSSDLEGTKTEIDLLYQIFGTLLDYDCESFSRSNDYRHYQSKVHPHSSVFIINTQNSNIKSAQEPSEYLQNLFTLLIEKYQFPGNRAAIFYLFDRDVRSNNNIAIIKELLTNLSNSRIATNYDTPGLMLLSYPAVESFIYSNFETNVFDQTCELGKTLKKVLHQKNYSLASITENTLLQAYTTLVSDLDKMGISTFDIDDFAATNLAIFDWEEAYYTHYREYKLLSLVSLIFIDLGLLTF